MFIRNAILSGLALLLLLPGGAQAEADLGSIDIFSQNSADSPVPKGWIAGGAVLGGQARYQAQHNDITVIPGALYFGERFMFLGDRARYYFYIDDDIALYGYGRYRFGNLDPDDYHAFEGMNKRKGELEGGAGGSWFTRFALLSARLSTDVTGRSKGQELLLWADFPVIAGPLLVMPGMGMMVRSNRMANYYFGGVSRAEATPVRQAWHNGTTISPMAALITSYRFSPHWTGMFAANYELYDRDIANSPLVQHRGEFYAITGVGYTW